jgi:hypothetical protein
MSGRIAPQPMYTPRPMLETVPIAPGTRVRVTQQLPQTHTVWTTSIEGVVCRFRQAKTGSWFAHAKADRLWLDRLEIRKDDGELVTLNLDRYSVIEAA